LLYDLWHILILTPDSAIVVALQWKYVGNHPFLDFFYHSGLNASRFHTEPVQTFSKSIHKGKLAFEPCTVALISGLTEPYIVSIGDEYLQNFEAINAKWMFEN